MIAYFLDIKFKRTTNSEKHYFLCLSKVKPAAAEACIGSAIACIRLINWQTLRTQSYLGIIEWLLAGCRHQPPVNIWTTENRQNIVFPAAECSDFYSFIWLDSYENWRDCYHDHSLLLMAREVQQSPDGSRESVRGSKVPTRSWGLLVLVQCILVVSIMIHW